MAALQSLDWRELNHAVGWLALFIYAFTWLFNFDLSRVGESIFLAAFVLALTAGWEGDIRKRNVLLIFALFLCVQVASFIYTKDLLANSSDGQWKSARHFSKLFLCVAVAWWVRGSVTAAKCVIFIFSAGFVFSFLISLNYSDVMAALNGVRVSFGYTNAQHTALYFGLLLIFSLFWLLSAYKRKCSILVFFLPVLFFILALSGVVVTQTRAVWLALAVLMTVALIVKALLLIKTVSQGGSVKREVAFFLLVVAAVTSIGSFFSPVIEKRIRSESDVINAVFEGELEGIPLTSIGIRVATWVYAIDKVKDRPLLGWGANSRKDLIQEGPFSERIKKQFGHFHNSYIEILLAYGVVGFLLLFSIFLLSIKGVLVIIRRGEALLGIGIFSAWLFFLIASFFESYIIFNAGIYYFVLIGGVGVSFYIFPLQNHRCPVGKA